MFVVNRQGDREKVCFDKILVRIQRLAYGLHSLVDPSVIAKTVINGMFSGIKTSELDELAAQTCAYMAGTHPDFSKLAARIATSNLHKNTSEPFSLVADKLYHYHDAQGRSASLLAVDVYEFIKTYAKDLDAAIDYSRDFDYDYFAFKTLERSYLLRVNGAIVERPQHMLMRVSCGIHCGNLEKVLETYSLLSQKYFTHATPTLFNAGTQRPQMSSCFLLTMKDDSIDGIYETLKNCALISKTAGGIGVSVHTIRATDSYIRGTNGRSNGIVPMLRVFNATARYVDQGGGKRKGSFAVYLEPWHADIMSFLDLKKNHGPEELRARDLFYALWIPDLFMQRVQENGNWTLFCPNECPGLADCWGAEFEKLYTSYESEKRGRSTVKARTLWFAILQSQIETGTPYMLYKDACNRKSNQKNLGTIRSSNLCTEIVEYTAPDEVAVCNLASLALPKFVDTETLTFNYEQLRQVTRVVTRNLNRIIDRNYYPLPEAEKSNKRHRPIGIGVQGLADALMLMKLPYESPEARKVNRTIFETIYFAAVECSVDLAKEAGGPYETYAGSPISEGKFQFDLWNEERLERGLPLVELSGLWDWERLREEVKTHGVRNSLLVAPMPTASTSQIMGNNESFEPYTANIYYRRVLSGEFFVVNPHLLRDLLERNLWSDSLKQQLIAANGSIQGISRIPSDLKALYKTVWEIRQKVILDMAADRAPFIDQSQSLNVHVTSPTYAKLSSMHFYGWKLGLKTGQYYLRTQAAADAIKFTVDHSLAKAAKGNITPLGVGAATPLTTEGGQSLLSKRFDALRVSGANLRVKGDGAHLSPDGDVLDDPLTPTSSSSLLSELGERLTKGNWDSGRTAPEGETFSTAGTLSVGLEDECTRKESVDTASSLPPVFGSGGPFSPESVSLVETPSSLGSSGNDREARSSHRNTLLGRRAAELEASGESSQNVTMDDGMSASSISPNATVKESSTSSMSENGSGAPFLFCPFRRSGMNDDEICEACSG